MSQSIQVNGQTINYPETGDTNWSDDATNFAIQTSAALGKIGLSSGTSVDITQTLDVTGNTTLDANLSVGGDASVTGNTTIAGTLGISNGTALSPAITPSGDTNTGLYSIGADKIGFSANGVRQGEFGVGYGGFTGNIIQVVQGQSNTKYSTGPASFATFSDGVSITPKYTNSKFLVIYVFSVSCNATSNYSFDFARKIGSGSIIQNISGKTQGISSRGGTATDAMLTTLIYLDSPTLTDLSAITYYLSAKNTAGTMTTMNFGTGTEFAPIIIAEVQQ